MDINETIKQYLAVGGLHNPELMEHTKVRDMILDAKKEIETLRADREKLVEALSLYADKNNCDNADFAHVEIGEDGEEIADGGFRARTTLKELGERE